MYIHRMNAVAARKSIHPLLPPLTLRPMARAERIAIFEREVRERLSRAALDALIGRAEVISEGQITEHGKRRSYLGSTMITFDLSRVSGDFREASDAGTARRLAALLTTDTTAKNRIRAVATREAEIRTQQKLHEISIEIGVRSKDTRVLVDVDVEATL